MSRVGGRPFEFRGDEIIARMRGVQPEEPRTHLVDVAGVFFPPKQVIAILTGWDRTTFTSLEARRVLEQAGLSCHRVDDPDGAAAHDDRDETVRDLTRRVEVLEAGLAAANKAIVKLLGQ